MAHVVMKSFKNFVTISCAKFFLRVTHTLTFVTQLVWYIFYKVKHLCTVKK